MDLCSDDEDILTFMKDHEIGTSFVMFYQVFGIVCERKRDFISTNKILLEGMQKFDLYEIFSLFNQIK